MVRSPLAVLVRRGAVLITTLATALLATVAVQVATAAPATAAQSCTDWTAVTDPEGEPGQGDDYVNDRSMYVQLEAQSCTEGGGTQQYVRALVHQVAEPSGPYTVDFMKVRVYRNNGCVGCESHYDSGEQALPGVGGTFYSTPVAVTPGVEWGGIVEVRYVDPPNPHWFMTAVAQWVPSA